MMTIRRFVRQINNPSSFISALSLGLSILGVGGLLFWIINEIQKGSIIFDLLSDPKAQITILGVIVVGFILIRNVFQDTEDLFFHEERITVGSGFWGTQYSYQKLFDDKCKEVIITGQNMNSLMSDKDFQNHIVALLKRVVT